MSPLPLSTIYRNSGGNLPWVAGAGKGTVVIGRVRVEMRRSGGFTGRTVQVRLDSAQMPPAEAVRLRELVSTLDLTRPGPPVRPSAGADLMRYDLLVEHDGGRWEGTLADPTIPAEMRPLLQFLTAAAR